MSGDPIMIWATLWAELVVDHARSQGDHAPDGSSEHLATSLARWLRHGDCCVTYSGCDRCDAVTKWDFDGEGLNTYRYHEASCPESWGWGNDERERFVEQMTREGCIVLRVPGFGRRMKRWGRGRR